MNAAQGWIYRLKAYGFFEVLGVPTDLHEIVHDLGADNGLLTAFQSGGFLHRRVRRDELTAGEQIPAFFRVCLPQQRFDLQSALDRVRHVAQALFGPVELARAGAVALRQ